MKKYYLLFLSALFLLLHPAAGQGTIDPEEWDHRMRIEIDHSKVDAQLSHFPVAVMLDESNFDFSLAEEDGSDIRFTDEGGENLLYFERELHDQTGQQAVYWVRIPTVNDTENTVFYIYYGNESADDAADDSGNVWDDDFRAVWHMDVIEGVPEDLRERVNEIGSWKKDENQPFEVFGDIGIAHEFNGDDFVYIVQDKLTISENITVGIWLKPRELSENKEAVIFGQKRNTYQIEIHENSGELSFHGFINNSEIIALAAVDNYSHVVLSYNGSNMNFYINGELANTEELTGDIETTRFTPFYMGTDFKGIIDEVQISDVARSDAWIKADYKNGIGDLLVYDKSGFDVTDPGSQIAGEPFDIDLTNARDIYGDNLEGDIDVTVTSSVETEGEGEDGVLYNDELNFSEGVATIPDVLLKAAGEHTLTISIDGVSNDETVDIDVGAAIAHAIVFITSEHTITANDTTEIITIQLQDEYGNEAVSSGETTINLSSDLTGTFRNEANDADITFVTVPDEGTQASFRYTSTVAGNHELSVTDDEETLEGDTQILTVYAGDPYRIVFITEEQVVYTGEVSEIITIQLEDEYGNAVESDGGTNVSLDNDTWDGEFLDDEGNELSTSNKVEIIDGETEVSFKYRPDEAGTHELTAEASGLEPDTHNLIVTDLKTWTGDESSEWDYADNWDPSGVPGDSDYIIIPASSADPVISTDVTVLYLDIQDGAVLTVDPDANADPVTGSLTLKDSGRLRIESGAKLTSEGDLTIAEDGLVEVKPNASLTAEGDLINNAGGEGLVIESSAEGTGSLILSESGNNDNVDATVQRYMKGGAWYVVSPPVDGQSISEFILNDQNDIPQHIDGYYAITTYDEEYGEHGRWGDYYFDDHVGNLEPGKSYLMRRREAGSMIFRGTLAHNDVSVTIVRSVGGGGWNSIGNPFASSLRVRGTGEDSFLGENASILEEEYAALYVYDHVINRYRIINNSGAGDRELDQDYIKPGQGVLVKSKDGVGNVEFTTSMRDHKHQGDGIEFKSHKSAGLPQKKSGRDPWPTVILSVSDEIRESTTVITFNENMTEGLDITYDAGLFGSDPHLQLYTRLVEGDNGVNIAIQCLPDRGFDVMVIPVGVDYSDGGQVTFSTDLLTLPDNSEAVLEDRELELFTNLEEEDYTAYLSSGSNGTGRFFLHIKSTLPGILPGDGDRLLEVFAANREVFINGMVEQGTMASMYDLMGRKVKSVNLEPSETNSFRVDDLNSGIYIIHVERNGVIKAERVLIE